ncbi:AraC family transcriptional regulator [Roseateles saccharophilus]|uniref:AraC family transcriptional regulator n=1 Tax=Roseateles saccharophilus TaxID=304 RepID=A0A4R3V0R0_ROSSA|nr:AraC family transcriptional regulator [Roseateles saccharophilus]MDG0832415.1 AraC family transcriptional regulator [Roseateles saccharophilus]TCU97110.1 AraC family transcriptional regulator [Roseateles saccharophilus]
MPNDDDLQTLRQRSIAQALARAPADGVHETALPWLRVIRASAPVMPLPAIYEPGLVLVLQGRKQARLGERTLRYDAMQCLLVPVTTLPRSHVVEASADKPYLCLRLSCETQALAELLMADGDAPAAPASEGDAGLQVAPVTAPLLDAALRLLRLLDQPQDLQALAPLVQREIFYRVLTGPLGPRLRVLAQGDGVARRLNRVIEQLTRRFAEPLSIDELAGLAHMSPSTLHLRFKQLTTLSPLQFQKTLRLQHARRLMLGDGLDAASAAHRVGYESPSQFSREYRRLFGTPPRSDARQLRGGPA